MASNEIALKEGVFYYVKLPEDDYARGKFKGYASLCGEVAMVIEMQDGKMRFIPIAQIVYIDQESPSIDEEKPKNIDIYYR